LLGPKICRWTSQKRSARHDTCLNRAYTPQVRRGECMREARNRFANLVKEAFEKAGREPIAFASEFKTAERREAFHALLAGDETPFAHHIAKAIAWRMSSSFDAELWATTFHEAYPSPDFKPMLIGANPELGMQVVMVIPDEADAM